MLDALFPYQPSDAIQALAVARAVRDAGLERLWLTHSLGLDASLLVAALAQRVPGLGFGTAVSLMPTRHPLQAAIDARTLSALTGGRFALGLGVSEPATVERTLGLRWVPGPRYAREYVSAVRALVRDGRVDLDGEAISVHADLAPVAAPAAPVLLGALGPRMGRVAGEVADGCVCWMTSPQRLADVIVPAVRAGAEHAGRPEPEIVAIVPVADVDDDAAALRVARHGFAPHLRRPHYRRVLADDGVPIDARAPVSTLVRDRLLVWGDGDALAAGLRRYVEAGATRIAVAAYLRGPDPLSAFASTLRTARAAIAAGVPS